MLVIPVYSSFNGERGLRMIDAPRQWWKMQSVSELAGVGLGQSFNSAYI
jgi:hypothetical protein